MINIATTPVVMRTCPTEKVFPSHARPDASSASRMVRPVA